MLHADVYHPPRLWATMFTAAWLRYENMLKHEWGTFGYEDNQDERP